LPKSSERTFRIRIYFKGKPYTETVSLKKWKLSLSELKGIEAKIRTKLTTGKYFEEREAENNKETFASVFESYYEKYKSNGKKCPDKVRSLFDFYYKDGLKNFGVDFSKKAMGEITVADIEKFKAKLQSSKNRRGREYQPQTIKNILNLISILFNHAIKKGLYKGENVYNRIDKIKGPKILVEYLTQSQTRKLLDVLQDYPSKPVANIIKFLLFTGIRRGEAFKLKWENVCFESRAIALLNTKSGSDKRVLISAEALKVLECQREFSKDSEYVFPDGTGGMRNPNNNIKEWYEIRRLAGIKIRLHSLRHTFATAAISSGVSLAVVQKMLTHKDISTTLKYAHIEDTLLKTSVEQVNDYFSKISGSEHPEETPPEETNSGDVASNVIKFDFVNKIKRPA
jgi:integrase